MNLGAYKIEYFLNGHLVGNPRSPWSPLRDWLDNWLLGREKKLYCVQLVL